MKNKFWLILALILLAAGGAYFVSKNPTAHKVADVVVGKTPPQPPDITFNPSVPDVVKATSALLNVPFVSQAPTGNWADQKQEDGCEEAAVLMSWLWINDKSITPADAEKTIINMADFETAHYGNYADTDAQDTAKFFTDYYGYTNIEVKINITIDDIKNALRAGKLVLAPANGTKLGNPHYKSPGPTTHFLVIKGFDDATGLFTTNDSGTQYGKNYTYNYQTLFNALVNYPTGNHLDQTGRPKAMIIVTK
ncbi:MAG: C39 family peptidase [Candidatus Doudnabacteria bacterium]